MASSRWRVVVAPRCRFDNEGKQNLSAGCSLPQSRYVCGVTILICPGVPAVVRKQSIVASILNRAPVSADSFERVSRKFLYLKHRIDNGSGIAVEHYRLSTVVPVFCIAVGGGIHYCRGNPSSECFSISYSWYIYVEYRIYDIIIISYVEKCMHVSYTCVFM